MIYKNLLEAMKAKKADINVLEERIFVLRAEVNDMANMPGSPEVVGWPREDVERAINQSVNAVEYWKAVEDRVAEKLLVFEDLVRDGLVKTDKITSTQELYYKDLYYAQKQLEREQNRLKVLKKHVESLLYTRTNCPKCKGTGVIKTPMAPGVLVSWISHCPYCYNDEAKEQVA